jgi:hypothetical protein
MKMFFVFVAIGRWDDKDDYYYWFNNESLNDARYMLSFSNLRVLVLLLL